jgi:MFS family permease
MNIRVVVLLCLAEALTMAGVSTYPALLPVLRAEWELNNTQAGLVGGAFFGGYMIAVPLLVGLTDRIAARRIYLVGCALLATGAAGFAAVANGVITASVFQAVAGAGLAGTYMPGLRELSDRVSGPKQSRAIAFYTSTFGIGTSLSLVLTDLVTRAAGWREAFAVAAAGPVIAAAIVQFALGAGPARARAGTRRLLDFGAVFRDRTSVGFIGGYASHCWELFALRSWMVAFFAFAAARTGTSLPWSAPVMAAAINLLGPAASVLGNEAAIGRRARAIVAMMCVSGALAFAVGLSASLSVTAVAAIVAIYFVSVMSDSAALTAGLVGASPQEARGGAMAAYSLGGFAAGFLAPLAFGAVLDGAGGDTRPLGWTLAFSSVAAVAFAGALTVRSFVSTSKTTA